MVLLIYCAGGFGREVMDIARRVNARQGRWDALAFIDDNGGAPKSYGTDVYRFEASIERFGRDGAEFVIANGEPVVRKMLRERIDTAGARWGAVVDETAIISAAASIGPGAIVFPGCFVSSQAALSKNVALVAGTAIGHDTVLGENTVVAGQVNVGGGCSIGQDCYIGMGAQIKEGTKIGAATVVGMGSVVFNDLPEGVIALGNPCRPMRPNVNKRVFQ
jgi:sugar O-acyltransferase (sialic acid O-acetyltransferase NeuD family)